MRFACRLVWLLCFVCLGAVARAESLNIALSKGVVEIKSNFTGAELSLFGTIQRDENSIPRRDPYDIIVVVEGPKGSIVTRQKERRYGIWLNNKKRLMHNVPYLFKIFTSKPLEQIALPVTVTREQLSLEALLMPGMKRSMQPLALERAAFSHALINLKYKDNLYSIYDGAIRFLDVRFFAVQIPLPARSLVGSYDVKVYLFAGQVLLNQTRQRFEIRKSGVEQVTYQSAFDYPLFYGIATILLALFIGWFGGTVFRRD
jgi:uncharacterized protein (TIGR02186 family)